ncbi:heavy-metal-associated domain-containing protein [Ferruginibacter sp.]|nr:heavy-metal-associated domain-containing protein [Ferruginibacter sp.]
MKKLLLGMVISCFALASQAQIKVKDKAVITLPTLQPCEQCKEQIEFFISKTDGVISVKVDLKRKTATIAWLTDRTNKEYLKTAIANLGFAADDIEAEEFAYKRLPACCKKPVEAPKPATPKG